MLDVPATLGRASEGLVWRRAGLCVNPDMASVSGLAVFMYLQRYHDVQVSTSGVWRILKRLEMNRLPSSQRYKPETRP
jgi:hypothetical protein